jgi:transposase
LIFLDESGVQTDMARRYGRAKGKSRVVDHTPQSHYKSITVVSAIRLSGVIREATMAMDCAMNAMIFGEYIEAKLAPALEPGDVVVMDNLSAHKGATIRQLIEVRGARLLYLPPYHPDLNPIEKMWSKMKAILRKIRARTIPDLITGIGDALSAVSAADLMGWYKHADYF